MELIPDGNMQDWVKALKRKKDFTEEDAARLIYQVLVALNYLHKSQYMHRDIKPENIMIQKLADSKENIVCKLTDFGLSTKYDPDAPPKDFCGSVSFVAPEIINCYS